MDESYTPGASEVFSRSDGGQLCPRWGLAVGMCAWSKQHLASDSTPVYAGGDLVIGPVHSGPGHGQTTKLAECGEATNGGSAWSDSD